MPVFLGIDGGGTKTAAKLVDETGKTLAAAAGAGISYRHHGEGAVLSTLRELGKTCAQQAKTDIGAFGGVCVGLPLYGEDAAMDSKVAGDIAEIFPAVHVVNDVQVAWAGSLGCAPGINVVAGTGSIAFGCNEAGQTARSGGWSEHFSDEGSGYWLGLKGMQLFSKQADGRLPRGALYTMVRAAYGLADDFEFVAVAQEELLPHRHKTAAFQKLLYEAAAAGDATVPPLYAEAARELADMALAVKDALSFEAEPVPVSYSGGIFKAGQLILPPYEQHLRENGMRLQEPLFAPVEGAVLLAARHFGGGCFNTVLAGLRAKATALP